MDAPACLGLFQQPASGQNIPDQVLYHADVLVTIGLPHSWLVLRVVSNAYQDDMSSGMSSYYASSHFFGGLLSRGPDPG
jgi:hypothetical protein